MKSGYKERHRNLSTPQEKGRLFERIWGKLLGTKPQPGSGNQWYAKLDVTDTKFLWSLKYTEKKTFSLSPKLMQEAEEAVTGNEIPGIAVSVDGHKFVIFNAEDFLRFCESGDYKYIIPSKAEQKRAQAKIPTLFRDENK